jgi:hypothetical protein
MSTDGELEKYYSEKTKHDNLQQKITILKKPNMTTYNMIRIEIVVKVNSNYIGCSTSNNIIRSSLGTSLSHSPPFGFLPFHILAS